MHKRIVRIREYLMEQWRLEEENMCTEELEKRDGALGAKRKLQKAVTNVQLQRSAKHSHHGKKGVPHLASQDFSERLAP